MDTPVVRTSLDALLQAELDDLKERQLFRTFHTVESAQGPVVTLDGREVLLFCSNNYLGLANHPDVIRAVQEAAARWGTGAGASRLVCGHMTVHEQFEQRCAAWLGSEAALLFGSGYLANLGTIPALVGPDDVILCDHLNHASLIDACRQSRAKLWVYPHAEASAVERLLARAAAFRRRLIVTDGLFSMDGDAAPLAALADAADRHEALLMVDDAHGMFVLGHRGRGTAEAAGVLERIDALMATCSKALGGYGGVVFGSRILIDHLRNHARSFLYATALPPTVAAGNLAALELVMGDPALRGSLLRNAERVRQGLQRSGIRPAESVAQIVPVLVGDPARTLRLAERLLKAGLFVPAIRPPTVPAGTARLRITVTAEHAEEQIDRLVETLHRCGRAEGLW